MSRAERAAQYRGDLRQTALPEMLAIIDRTRVAGVIEATYGDFSKRVFLDSGHVVHAASSDLADSLGSYLRRTGRLSEPDFQAAMARRRAGPRRLGELLIEEGLLSPAQVHQAIREHVEAILWSLFSWEEGEVSFAIGQPDLTGLVRIQIPLRQVILQGIVRAANAKSLVQRMGGRDARFAPSFRYEDLIEIALDGEGYGLLARVDGKKSLYELCTGGPVPAADAARLLYAFSVLGLIRRGEPGEAGGRAPATPIKIKLRSDT
jgi:two-component system OmpR family response regulator